MDDEDIELQIYKKRHPAKHQSCHDCGETGNNMQWITVYRGWDEKSVIAVCGRCKRKRDMKKGFKLPFYLLPQTVLNRDGKRIKNEEI